MTKKSNAYHKKLKLSAAQIEHERQLSSQSQYQEKLTKARVLCANKSLIELSDGYITPEEMKEAVREKLIFMRDARILTLVEGSLEPDPDELFIYAKFVLKDDSNPWIFNWSFRGMGICKLSRI